MRDKKSYAIIGAAIEVHAHSNIRDLFIICENLRNLWMGLRDLGIRMIA